MSMQEHAKNKIAEIESEIKVIARWFDKTHGGPEIYESDLAEMQPETRVVTQAMLDRREALRRELVEWKK